MSKKIEGIPEGWRIVRVGTAHDGEYIVDMFGSPVREVGTATRKNHVIIEKIIKYRNVTPDDIGKMVEVNIDGNWYERELLAILPEKFDYRYIFETAGGNDWSRVHEARIKE